MFDNLHHSRCPPNSTVLLMLANSRISYSSEIMRRDDLVLDDFSQQGIPFKGNQQQAHATVKTKNVSPGEYREAKTVLDVASGSLGKTRLLSAVMQKEAPAENEEIVVAYQKTTTSRGIGFSFQNIKTSGMVAQGIVACGHQAYGGYPLRLRPDMEISVEYQVENVIGFQDNVWLIALVVDASKDSQFSYVKRLIDPAHRGQVERVNFTRDDFLNVNANLNHAKLNLVQVGYQVNGQGGMLATILKANVLEIDIQHKPVE